MFLSNLIKFFAAFALLFALFPACRFWQSGDGEKPREKPFVAEELKSAIPFATREPDVFQAEMVIMANDVERKTFIARSGERRRYDYDFGTEHQLTFLKTDKEYLILVKNKIYAEISAAQNGAAAIDDWQDFLTTEWLNARREASFEKLEQTENITKYLVRLDGKVFSEVIIAVDETNNLPVRQEFYSVSGAAKTLLYTFELRNVQLQADENLFAAPADFRKVPAEELRKTLSKNGER